MSKVTFRAEPGSRLSFHVGGDARLVEYVFDSKGELKLDESDPNLPTIQAAYGDSASQPVTSQPSDDA
jgi:hypothetical protein